jgi:ABC-2 type transport system permease protein
MTHPPTEPLERGSGSSGACSNADLPSEVKPQDMPTETAKKSAQPHELYDSAIRSLPVRGAIRDLYRYRALLRLLVVRDLTVRYKRSVLGVTWTVLNPLLTSLILWFVFNRLFHAKIPGNVPYIIYLLSGILAITYFQQGVAMTSASLVMSASLLTKVYVPPVVFAFAASCSGAINFTFGLVPLLAFQLALGVGVPWTLVMVPIPLVFLLAMIAGIGLFLTTFAVRFDDVLNVINNVLLVIVAYVTPIFYPITIIPSHYRKLFYLNPMYSYVGLFRHLEYGGPAPSWISLVIIAATGTLGLALGLTVFVRRWPKVAVLL